MHVFLVLVSTVVIRVNVFENDETAVHKMHHTICLVCHLLNTVLTFIRYHTRTHLTYFWIKVKQCRYRPRGLQEVKVPRFHDNSTGWW